MSDPADGFSPGVARLLLVAMQRSLAASPRYLTLDNTRSRKDDWHGIGTGAAVRSAHRSEA